MTFPPPDRERTYMHMVVLPQHVSEVLSDALDYWWERRHRKPIDKRAWLAIRGVAKAAGYTLPEWFERVPGERGWERCEA